MLVAEDGDAGGVQVEVPGNSRVGTQVAGSEDAEEVAVPEEGHVTITVFGIELAQQYVGPRPGLGGGLSSGAAVAKEVPIGALRSDVGTRAALVGAVVELGQRVGDLHPIVEAGQA